MIADIVTVQELIGPSFHPGNRDLYAGIKGVFNDPSVGKAFEFGPYKSRAFTWLYMLELDNGI